MGFIIFLGKSSEKKEESLMDKFKPASGTWECTSCMVRNIETATKCIACETLREAPKKEMVKPLTGFSSQFKLSSSDKWECGVCLVRNKNEDSKCVACTNPKPVKTSQPINNIPQPTSSSFGDKFKPSSDTWECSVCMIRNKSSSSKCVACESPKPGGKSDKPSLIMPPAMNNKSGFGDLVKKQQERWECSTCLVRNPTEAKSCTSCGTYRPGVPQFNFGTSPNTPKFKFGIDNSSTEAKTNSGFILGANTSSSSTTSFKFGIPSTTSAPINYQFGAQTSTTATPISFGTSKVDKVPDKAPQFSFGVPEKKSPKPDVVVIDDDDDDEQDIPAKKSKPEPQKEEKQDGFLFGAKPKNGNEGNLFSNLTSPPTNSEVPKPMFNFGQPTTTGAAEKKITFDIPVKENKSEPEKAQTFNFGSPKSAPTASVASTSAPQMFSFGAPAPASTTTSEEPKSTFGSTFQVPKFNFGSNTLPLKSNSESIATVTTTQSSMFSFGSSSTTNVPKPSFDLPKQEVKPFSFGAPSASVSKPDFAFKPSSSAPSFNFGGNASSAVGSSNNMFSFEPASQKSISDNQASTFGANSNEGVNNKPTMFGSAISGASFTSGAAQAQSLNNGFNFAAPSNTSSTFKFGSTNPASATAQPPAVFSFGQVSLI